MKAHFFCFAACHTISS